MADFALTTLRVLNRRGVMWLSQWCNLGICRTLVDLCGKISIDIQDGEPIWAGRYPLVSDAHQDWLTGTPT